MPGIFLLQDDESLVEMNEQPYDSEDLLQELLAKYPNLLAGDQMESSDPRRWLLIRREMGIPSKEEGGGRWSVDHLFLDQDAVPTLVEVKRSSDTRIRREVVGQMLDYAANAVVYWPVEQIRAEFKAGVDDWEEELSSLLGDEGNPEEFWQKVKTNLQAGKIRMVFVADVIPTELRRIVEFLNEQMDPAEVLAVEIKQFVGEGMKTLVPRVMGQTAEAERKKGSRGTTQIDEEARLEFWTAFYERAKEEAPEIELGSPTGGPRISIAVDDPDLTAIAVADCHVAKLSIRLSISGPDAPSKWERLRQYIEEHTGSLMSWRVGHGKRGKAKKYNVGVVADLNMEARDTWLDQHRWLLRAVTELLTKLLPVVR